VDLYLKLLTRFFQSVSFIPRRSDFVSPNLQFGDWINREFVIPTAEKQVMRSRKTFVFDAMFCRLATMEVANSRLECVGIANPQKLGEGKASGFVRDAFWFGHILGCQS
jgi:hypothetical protein